MVRHFGKKKSLAYTGTSNSFIQDLRYYTFLALYIRYISFLYHTWTLQFNHFNIIYIEYVFIYLLLLLFWMLACFSRIFSYLQIYFVSIPQSTKNSFHQLHEFVIVEFCVVGQNCILGGYVNFQDDK